jgi:hypothetical protein
MKKELVENPEFFKAYPHLQSIFMINEARKDDLAEEEAGQEVDQFAPYQHDKVFNFSEHKKEEPYFNTLL